MCCCGTYANQPTRVAFNNVALTAAFTGNQYAFETGGMMKLTLDVNYTRGGGEVSSKMFFKLEHTPDDGVNWYSLVIDTTGATSVVVPREWEIGTTNKLNVIVDIAYKKLRLSLRESGVVTNAGTATVSYTVSGL